jgi:predicted MPP superfamily phosphohydrolase
MMGFLGLFTLVFLIMDLKNLFDKVFHPKTRPMVDHSRRDFFKKNLALSGIAASTVVSGVGFANSFDPKVKHVEIPLSDEHKNLHGLKIVQLSDVHIGPTLKKDFCVMLKEKVDSLNADVVVLTGDLVDGKVDYLKEDLAPLTNLKSKLGIFYITGNHEYYWYADEWIDWARQNNLNPLINENRKLNYNNTDFYIAGVNDHYSVRLDPKKATNPKKAAEGIPKSAYKILLAHQPKACYQAVQQGFHTQLSGHTHGGQGFPWNIIVSMVQPYIRGLNNHEGMNVYVHSGTGFWGPPNRFMVDSEIAEIVFTHQEKKV